MAYSELIKNFNRVRDYMREFYVYGFKSRDEYRKKSGRSYDDERRRIESFFGDHMQFRQTADGKNVFLSIDSRSSRHNPLYKAWKAKSFTDGDITLHFILMDILMTWDKPLTIHEITEQIDRYLSGFARPRTFDESTVRKKLKEYASEGLVEMQKDGKTVFYLIGNLRRLLSRCGRNTESSHPASDRQLRVEVDHRSTCLWRKRPECGTRAYGRALAVT